MLEDIDDRAKWLFRCHNNFSRPKKLSEIMALNTKDIVKIISKKEEFPDAVVTFIPQQKTLNAQARPTKPENLVFVVHKNDDGSFSFENTANGT